MSPRGVAIPDARERLFAAAERVVARAGPGALTSRAVTEEAGCAKGLLHAHFAGLDEFVAELVLDRFVHTVQQVRALPGRAGSATVAGNLRETARGLLTSPGPAVAGLALSRPEASARIRAAWEAGAPGFGHVQDAVTAYLDAEGECGRLAGGADTHALALALVGTVHHLLMTGPASGVGTGAQADRVIAALVDAARGWDNSF